MASFATELVDKVQDACILEQMICGAILAWGWGYVEVDIWGGVG